MANKKIYYHFTGETLRDGRPIPPIGEWLIHDGEIIMCEQGFHAFAHPFDALNYAPGQFLHKVELGGRVITEGNRSVARKRKIVATVDATELLWRCARLYALEVIHLWNAPEVVVKFLKTGDESLRAAAMDSAWAAGYAAGAVGDAAGYARAAARAAARSAWAAARYAAWAAARYVAGEKQRTLFAEEVEKEFAKAGE